MKDKLKKIDLLLLVLLAFVIKMIGFGTDFASAIALFPLCGVYCYHRFLKRNSIREINTNAVVEITKKINDMQGKVDSLQMHQGLKGNEKAKIRKF